MPLPDEGQSLQINVSSLKEMIQQVVFAASNDEARPVLTGVLVSVSGNRMILAAADGFRLSVRKAELSSPAPRTVNAVIPARALSELARIASDGEQLISMILPPNRGQVIFRLQDAELSSQLIDGTFPDYEQIIPRRWGTRAVLSTTEFLRACKRAEIFAREGSHIARIQITPGESELVPGEVQISGQSEETGDNENRVPASIQGPSLVIAFNVRFLREVLDVLKTPNVALEVNTETTPGVIRPADAQSGEGDFLHVIMPMHLG